jgi:hypothetical protein
LGIDLLKAPESLRYALKPRDRAAAAAIPVAKARHLIRVEHRPSTVTGDVRYVLSAENRSAGSVMRFQLAPYCNEQRFIFERWRNH